MSYDYSGAVEETVYYTLECNWVLRTTSSSNDDGGQAPDSCDFKLVQAEMNVAMLDHLWTVQVGVWIRGRTHLAP